MMNNFLKKSIIYLFTSLLILISIIGCWEFISIDQPEFADRNSTFDVPITVALTEEEGSGRGYFGIRLPSGWTVEDSIAFTETTIIFS